MSDRDYYEILGLTPRADGAMVDQAYWHLARKYQSLAATNARAQHLLDELNEAYGVLGNPSLRRQYDAFRDDVLLTRGMIKPVKARPEPERAEREPSDRRQRSFRVPGLSLHHWPAYLVAAAIVALALAGAAQGVNAVIVIGALVGGMAFALLPTVHRRVSSINFALPAMPSVSMPEIQAPRITMPEIGTPAALRDLGANATKDEPMDADELRKSTAATIARWRTSIGLREAPASDGERPDTTLVDIVKGERDLDGADEPLTAVIDILRGARKAPASRKS
jgi:hypothetical protein